MLECDRIDLSEGIDNKKCKEASRECSLCKIYDFLDKNFNYGPYLCNGCYDISLKAILLLIMEIIIVLISRLLAKKMHLIKNALIIDKKGTL